MKELGYDQPSSPEEIAEEEEQLVEAGLQKIDEDTNVFQPTVIHTGRQIILRACDLITIAVPPTLPTIMSSQIQFDLTRQKDWKIVYIAQDRINVVFKVKVVCFDQTVTFNEEDLEITSMKKVQDVKKRVNLN
ncbi:MAG: hypothetical protein EZS28_025530 [Streblomastix strix]|uniref:Uncharacterized protein n=1 Tax=Streblomastix strix TaxID=222440 RepID=A0A5J4V931_9EUKA|nr:MAG: hypothetical protein EZS28_025530 [Streblomastix strix]